MLRKLWNDEFGVIISAELVLVLTIAVLAMVVGLQSVSKVINHELNDLASAFSVLDQSFSYEGIQNTTGDADCDAHARVEGAAFGDRSDDCDCTELMPVKTKGKAQNNSNGPEAGSTTST